MENTKGKKSSVASKLVSGSICNTEENASGNVSETSSSDDDPEALLDNYNTEDVDAHNYNNMIILPRLRVWVLVQWVQACYVINLKRRALMILQLQILRLINCQRR